MAVRDAYVESNVSSGKITAAAQSRGAELRGFAITFETLAADDAGSKYRLIKGINPDAIILDLKAISDAVTGASDVDLGFYESLDDNGGGGAVISKDVLANGIDLSSALTHATAKDGLVSVDPANLVKRVYELCGHTQTTKKRSYDLVLTINSEVSAAGTITVMGILLQG